VSDVGWAAEGNYVIRRLGELGGAALPILFKSVVIVGALVVMWRIYNATQVAAVTARTDEARRRTSAILRTQAAATAALLVLYVYVIGRNALIVWEAFKVYGGQIHAVEAFMETMPAGAGDGWD